MIELDVLGTPAPKGSGRAMMIAGRARHVPSSSSANQRALRAWSNAIAGAVEAQGIPGVIVGRALAVTITFRLARPAGHYGRRGIKPASPRVPIGKPDADKLARSTLDALTGLVFDDDSRIVELMVAKAYADPGKEGASITVEEWQP